MRTNQSKAESWLEATLNVASGYVLALVVWTYVIKPLWSLDVSLGDNVVITGIFTVVSVLRSYVWRRAFEDNWWKR